MKLKNSLLLIFLYSLLFFSIYLVLVSKNLLVTWMGLELKVFSTLPILMLSSKFSFIRAKVHVFMYFLFQTVGSLMIMAGFCLGYSTVVLIGLLVKLGIFPLKFWVPLVFSTLTWIPMFVLLVLNKIPLLYLFSVFKSSLGSFAFCLLTSFLGIMALYFSTKNMKLFICWSSVVKTGFMCMVFSTDTSAGVSYFILYTIVMFFMSYFFHFSSVDYVSTAKVSLGLKKSNCFISGKFVLLILAGLPIFFSWFVKIVLINSFSVYKMMNEPLTSFFGKIYFLVLVLKVIMILKICAYLKFFVKKMLFVFSNFKNLSKMILKSLLYLIFVYFTLLMFFS